MASPSPNPVELYLRAAKDAGCPREQVGNFLRARLVLQPQQLRFAAAARECDQAAGPTEIGYGGARGGGKSWVGLAQILCDDGARYPGLKFLYLRKVGKSGKEAVHDLRRQVLHSTPHDFKANTLIRKDNGSRVILGHFQYEKDIDTYLGLEYDGVLIEEATQLSSRKIRDIGTCVRTSKPGWRPRKYFTTNPGNIGHAWFKARFIDPHRRGTETTTRFIQATVRDNAFVNPEYRCELESLTGWQRRAWLDGDWDIAAGQFFTNFRREAVEVLLDELPRHWRVWLGFDYGFTHFTVVYLLAQDGDGTVYVIDEHAERQWLPDQHVDALGAMLARWRVEPERLETIAAGHDVFSKDQRGKTIAGDYEDLGLYLERANIDRINGAAEILKRLGDPDRGKRPTVRINATCVRLLDCLPSLQHDPHRPEDVLKVDCDDDGLGGDDFYDSFRYAIMHAAVGPSVAIVDSPDWDYRG